MTRLTQRVLFFAVGVWSLAQVCLAAEIDESWCRWAARTSSRLRVDLLRDGDAEKMYNQKVAENLRVTPPLKQEPSGPEHVSLQKNKLIVAGQQYSMGEYDAKKLKDKLYAIGWAIPLRNDTPFLLQLGFSAKIVLLNGQPLAHAGDNFWTEPDWGTMEVRGKTGNNILIVIPSDALKGKPDILVIPGDTVKRATDEMARDLTRNMTKPRAEKLREVLKHLAVEAAADGENMARGFLVYAEYMKSRVPGKETENDIGSLGRYIMDNLRMGGAPAFLHSIRKWNAPWLTKTFLYEKDRFARQSMESAIDALADSGRFDEALKLVGEIRNEVTPSLKNDKERASSYASLLLHVGRSAFINNGLYDVGLQLLKEAEQYADASRNTKAFLRSVEKTRESALVRSRTAIHLAADPEAEQRFQEFRRLTEREDDDRRSLNSIFQMFKQHGTEAMQSGQQLHSLRSLMLDVLRRKPKLYTAMRSYSEERLGDTIQDAVNRSDLSALEDLTARYAGLINTDPVHYALLVQYADRCDYEKARYHALSTLAGKNNELRAKAMAHLLIIEKLLGIGPEQRMSLPEELERLTVNHKGKNVSLGNMRDDVRGKATNTETLAAAPGKHIGSISLPREHRPYYRLSDSILNSLVGMPQLLEPAATDQSLYLAATPAVQSIDLKSGALNWLYSPPPGRGKLVSGSRITAFPALVAGRRVLFYSEHEEGGGFGIRALDSTGRRLWDTSDHEVSRRWEPICAPVSAFGMIFTLVRNVELRDQIQVGVARVDSLTGRVVDVSPINQINVSHGVDRVRGGARFAVDDSGLYGCTATGALFRVGRETLSLDWVAAEPVQKTDASLGPAGFSTVIGDRLISLMPGADIWMCVDKQTGSVLWRSQAERVRYLHSRDSDEAIIVSAVPKDRRPVLARIDVESGRTLWRVELGGILVTGEGTVFGNEVYVPTDKGLGVYDIRTGSFIRSLSMNAIPLKIRRRGDRWIIFTEERVHLFGSGGEFEGKKVEERSVSTPLEVVDISPAKESVATYPRLEDVLTLPVAVDMRDNPYWVPTSKPSHWALRYNSYAALVQEGGHDKKGRYVPPRIVWSGFYPNARVSEQYLVTSTGSHIRVLDVLTLDEKLVIRPPDWRESLGHGRHAINDLHVKGNRLAYVERSNAMFLVELPGGKLIGQGKARDDNIIAFDGRRVVIAEGRNDYTCYDLENDGKEVWQQKKRRSTGVRGDFLFLWDEKGWKVQPLAGGKAVDVKGNGTKDHVDGAVIGDLAFIESGGAVNLKNGKSMKDVLVVIIGQDRQGVLLLTEKSFTWYAAGRKPVELKYPGEWTVNEMKKGERGRHAVQRGNLLYFFLGDRMTVYMLSDGQPVNALRLVNGDSDKRPEVMLDRTFVVRDDYNLYMVGADDEPSPNQTQVASYPTAHDTRGWPQEHWAAPVDLTKSPFWSGVREAKPVRPFLYWLGADMDWIYLHLSTETPPPERYEALLDISGEWNRDGESRFLIRWTLDSAGECVLLQPGLGKAESWQQVDQNGVHHYYMRIDRDSLRVSRGDGRVPRVQMTLEERILGRRNGVYRTGGVIQPRLGRVPAVIVRRIDCQSQTNYSLREQLYSQSTAFLAQGDDLARWMQTRRAHHGIADNIRFLEGMVKRTAKNFCVVNVLGALFLEKIEALREKNPTADETREDFATKRLAVAKEIKSFAVKSGVDPTWCDRALTSLVITFLPRDLAKRDFFRSFKVGEKDLRHWEGFSLNRGSFVVGSMDRPFTVVVPMGLHEGDPLKDLGAFEVQIDDPWYDIVQGPVRVERPDGWTDIIKPDASFADGANYHERFETEKTTERRGTVTEGYFYKKRYARLVFEPLVLGPVPKDEGLSPENLLIALKSLPSDSRIGLSLVDAYVRKTKEQEGALSEIELYAILLKRVSDNASVVVDVMKRMQEKYTKEFEGDEQKVFSAMNRFMRDGGVPRGLQRRIFTVESNDMVGGRYFANLGPVRASDGAFVPEPERTFPLWGTDFLLGEKAYQFRLDINPKHRSQTGFYLNGWRQSSRDYFMVYHAFVLRADKAKKIYLYFKRYNRHHENPRISVWHEGVNLLADERIDDWEAQPVPVRLNEGENIFLLQVQFAREWDIRCHIGDSWGVPVDGVVLKDLTAVMVDNQEPRKPDRVKQPKPGVQYKVYEGTWNELPDFGKLKKAAKSGETQLFDLSVKHRDENYALWFKGYIQVPATGMYSFFTRSDDGSRLLIGKTEVVLNDGLHGLEEQSGTILLAKGMHEIVVEMFQQGGGQGLEVLYEGPNIKKQAIPQEVLFHK